MKSNNIKRQAGYSRDLSDSIFDSSKPKYNLSIELSPQFKFEENKLTDEVVAYRAWFSQEGLPPFEVKFENQVTLPNYLAVVELENLEACEVGYNIYFRASGIVEVK